MGREIEEERNKKGKRKQVEEEERGRREKGGRKRREERKEEGRGRKGGERNRREGIERRRREEGGGGKWRERKRLPVRIYASEDFSCVEMVTSKHQAGACLLCLPTCLLDCIIV